MSINKNLLPKPLITYEELLKHRSREDCWISIQNKVVDVTSFLANHPGGEEVLLVSAGADATGEFNKKGSGKGHSDQALSLIEKFWIGNLDLNSLKAFPNRGLSTQREFSYKEISRHDKKEDCWIIIDDKVYNVTDYLNIHPGGFILILDVAGKDATQSFHYPPHSESAKKILKKYQIGILDTSSTPVKEPLTKTIRKAILNPAFIMLVIGLLMVIFIGAD